MRGEFLFPSCTVRLVFFTPIFPRVLTYKHNRKTFAWYTGIKFEMYAYTPIALERLRSPLLYLIVLKTENVSFPVTRI